MKVRNSLKSLRSRHRSNRLVRRKGRVYVINKVQRRFKARQGCARRAKPLAVSHGYPDEILSLSCCFGALGLSA